MPDIPVFRLNDDIIPGGLGFAPFLVWAGDRSRPRVPDVRSGLLYRAPEHLGTARTSMVRTTPDGRTLLSVYKHAIDVEDSRLVSVTSTPGGGDQQVVGSVDSTFRHRVRADIAGAAGLVTLGLTTRVLGGRFAGLRGGHYSEYNSQVLLRRTPRAPQVFLDLPFHDLLRSDEELNSVQPSPDGGTLAVTSSFDPPERTDSTSMPLWSTTLWSTETGAQVDDHPWLALHGTRSWSPDGTRLLVLDARTLHASMPAPRILDLTTGDLTCPPGLPPVTYMLPRTRFHRILGWAGNEHIVTAYKAGRTHALNLVELATGDVEPVATIHNDVYTWFQIAALTPDEWRNLRDLPA